MKRQELPEGKEVTVNFELGEVEECLKYLPPSLEKTKIKIEEAVEHVNFWNFLRECEYLEFVRADFHFTGLMRPGWHLYCKHPENKGGPVYIKGLSEEIKVKITSGCSRENCPIYNR